MSHIEILSPEDLEKNHQPEYPAYTLAQWREAVAAGHTIDGYWVWVHNSLCDEVAEADAEEDMDVSQVTYANRGTCTPIDAVAPSPAYKDNTAERLYTVIAEQLGVRECDLSDEKDFADDLGADSLDNVEMVMAVEEEFEIEITDEEAEAVKTVGQALELVRKKIRG